MDYRKFLSKRETVVLPYFGGARVDGKDRSLRIRGEAEPGWWQFEVEGRRATPVKRADPIDLSELPAVRGHYAEGWVFSSGRDRGRIALAPDMEPEPFAPVTARRWYTGELLMDAIEFEDEAEDATRRAFEEGRALGDTKGVAPSLRAAFGFAVLSAAARAADAPISAREAGQHVLAVAERGRDAADEIIRHIVREREEWLRLLEEERRNQRLSAVARDAALRRIRRVPRNARERAERALAEAGARLLRYRNVGDGQSEVTFTFMDERFIAVVDAVTLNVHDAGICLQGADRELTLESLPSAIREAIEVDILHITRY